MKKLLAAAVISCIFSVPSFAAQSVYLQDGSVIKAKKVWRSKGMVHVLVNRDTLADFNNSEVNLKKTFKKKPARAYAKKQSVKQNQAGEVATIAPAAQTEKKKSGISMPAMPSLPQKSPDVFTGKDEGAIRKHKREMSEKAGE